MAKRMCRVLLSLVFMLLLGVDTMHAQQPDPEIVILVVDSFNPNPFNLDEEAMQNMYEVAFAIIAEMLPEDQSEDQQINFGNDVLQQAVDHPAIGGVLGMALQGMDILPDSSENCAIQPEGQIHATLGMTSGTRLGIPHGELVYYVFPELEAHLRLLGNNGIDVNTDVVRVDTESFKTTIIVDRIKEAIDNNPASRYIVNMSFAIIPCSKMLDWATYQALRSTANGQLGDFDAAKFLDDYQTFTGNAPHPNFQVDQFYAQLGRTATDDIGQVIGDAPPNDEGWYAYEDDDPLRDFLRDSVNNNIVSVAAAGNLNYEFPLYPAALDNVISVAMTQRTPPNEEDIVLNALNNRTWQTIFQTSNGIGGNWGEAMLPGLQVYPMTQSDFVSNYLFPPGELLSAAGSSIAAPQLSYLIAAYLASNPVDTCFTPPNTPAYIRENSWGTTSASAVNKPLSDFTATQCIDFHDFLVSNDILP